MLKGDHSPPEREKGFALSKAIIKQSGVEQHGVEMRGWLEGKEYEAWPRGRDLSHRRVCGGKQRTRGLNEHDREIAHCMACRR